MFLNTLKVFSIRPWLLDPRKTSPASPCSVQMHTEQGCLIAYREAMARNPKMYEVRQDLNN